MEIKGLGIADQLKMLRGAGNGLAGESGNIQETGNKASSFYDFLKTKVGEINELGLDVDRKVKEATEGKSPNPHETMIAIQKADVSFRLMLTVKEQLEQAYQQIMRSAIG